MCISNNLQFGEGKNLENTALEYFCSHIEEINKGLVDYNIRFSGYTLPKYSRIYNLASCENDINLFKDSIPNKDYLDELEKYYTEREAKKIKINYECEYLKRSVFAPFNKKVYTLHVFNAVEYKGKYYVEIYLVNKRMDTWTIGISLDKNSYKPLGYCSSFVVY
jgi:hypothetical protein